MKRSKEVIAGLLVLALWFIPASALAAKKPSKGITFLNDVEKVEWYRVHGKHIIIG